MSKRQLVAKTLDRFGVWGAILGARKAGIWPWSGLTVVLYHRVVQMDHVGSLDPELVDATPDEFDQQMAFLRRHFAPVGLPEVLAAAEGVTRLPPNALLVSFDDGYRDNFEHALPILLRHGMKGVFFLSTSYITERRLFWWEQVSLFVRQTTRERVELLYPEPITLDLRDAGGRAAAIKRLNRLIKDHFALDLDRLLGELATACGVAWSPETERALGDATLMTWDHARGLLEAGMSVGSHTCNHRVLQTLPAVQLDRELAESRQELQTRLGTPIDSIAYPVGRSIAARPPIRDALRRAGYQVGFTALPGINRFRGQSRGQFGGRFLGQFPGQFPGDDLFDLKRLPIDRGTPMAATRANLAAPWLAR